jgi:sugar lactone lactonase YvrE
MILQSQGEETHMKLPRLFVLFVVAAMVGLVAPSHLTVSAQDATPVGTPTLPAGCEVIASGLLNPRQLDVASDGTIYVTEAGVGGDEKVTGIEESEEEQGAAPSPVASPGAEEAPPATRGMTGQVSAIAPDGTQTVVADGLPSYSDGVGPAGVVAVDGTLYVAIGGSYGLLGIDPLENEGHVVSIDPASGTVTSVADLGAYEVQNNPDGTDVNPNLYGMDIGADGQLYVADAGGNTVYKVDPATGDFSLLGIVPQRTAAGEPVSTTAATPQASPAAGGEQTFHAVPTAVFTGADGNIYVGLLGALVPGIGGVTVVQADGTFRDVVSARTAVVGVAVGPDGLIHISEISLNIGAQPPAPGDVVRAESNGTVTPILGGLSVPNGINFDQAGNLLVIVNSVAFGPQPDGQVWRCSPTISTGTASVTSNGLSMSAAKFGES